MGKKLLQIILLWLDIWRIILILSILTGVDKKRNYVAANLSSGAPDRDEKVSQS